MHNSQPPGEPTALLKGQARTGALIASMIPTDLAKQLDQEEIADRLAAAARLLEKARGATGVVASGFGEMARDLLKAQPRAKTQVQVRDLLLKSAQATSAGERERYRAAAEQVKARHPMAPRRRPPSIATAVVKAKDLTGMVPCYDANGELVGLVPKDKLIPVEPVSQESIEKAHARGRRQR